MPKTIAVVGSTGMQGGSVARTLLKEGWNVRAITRKPESDAAKALEATGATIVQADNEDEASLVKAFEGSQAIFAMVDYFGFVLAGESAEDAITHEELQAMNLARAASKIPTLEHYLYSTLPHASRVSNTPQIDYQSPINKRIHAELPELAAKTTWFVFGFYPTNMAYFPVLKPCQLPTIPNTWVQISCLSANALTGVTGDMDTVPGQYASAILARPQKTKTKYAYIAPEALTAVERLKIWGEVMGRRTAYIETTADSFVDLLGPVGAEMALQWKASENEPWTAGKGPRDVFLSLDDLGIKEFVGFRATIERLKHLWE